MNNYLPSPELQAYYTDQRTLQDAALIQGGAHSVMDQNAEYGPRLQITGRQYDALQEAARTVEEQGAVGDKILHLILAPEDQEPQEPQTMGEWEAAANHTAELMVRIDDTTSRHIQMMEGLVPKPSSDPSLLDRKNRPKEGEFSTAVERPRTIAGVAYDYKVETFFSQSEQGGTLTGSRVRVKTHNSLAENLSKGHKKHEDEWDVTRTQATQSIKVEDGHIVSVVLEEGKEGAPAYRTNRPHKNILATQFTQPFPKSLIAAPDSVLPIEAGKVAFNLDKVAPSVYVGDPMWEGYNYVFDPGENVFKRTAAEGPTSNKSHTVETLSVDDYMNALDAALGFYPSEEVALIDTAQAKVSQP